MFELVKTSQRAPAHDQLDDGWCGGFLAFAFPGVVRHSRQNYRPYRPSSLQFAVDEAETPSPPRCATPNPCSTCTEVAIRGDVSRALIRPDLLYGWKGPSLLIVNTRGECDPSQGLSGYYFREARFLSTCRLEIDGQRPWLCEAASLDPDLLQFAYTFDDWRDEEPGRIPYQMRRGPLAILSLNPYSAYYADFASPLMFVISLANLYAWTGDTTRLRRYWDTARRILDWAREHGDRDADGYLEYLTRSTKGTKNQGWKDSGDAVIYGDGSPVPPPIATCELQGYWYAAQQLMGFLSWMNCRTADAQAYLEAASDLKARFNRDWWHDEDEFFALAMDPDKRLVRAASSNVGHCLASGIIDANHIPPVVGRLFAPDMFSGWGIRTLSAEHGYYNPVSYHRGTVWAVEQATILFGLRRFGFDARARSGACAVRSRAAVSGVSDSRMRGRVSTRRAAHARRLSSGKCSAALERHGISARGAMPARCAAAGARRIAGHRSRPALVASRSRRKRPPSRPCHRDAALLAGGQRSD